MITRQLITDVEALMREASDKLILPRFQKLEQHEIDTKTHATDLVTVADREAEAWLTLRLEALIPGSVTVGEEAVSDDPSVIERLSGEAPVWLVDPVDGTANFVKGEPRFGVMVALVEHGRTKAGFIFAPIERAMAIAIEGKGATLNGASFESRKDVPFAKATSDYSSKYVEPHLRAHLDAAVKSSAGTRAGHCSAYAYLDAARGEIDFVLQYLMSPWDHAAGVLLVTEAGGAVKFIDDGEAYTPVPRKPRAMLAAGDAAMWDAYREAIL